MTGKKLRIQLLEAMVKVEQKKSFKLVGLQGGRGGPYDRRQIILQPINNQQHPITVVV